jgi:hypothetical protein
VLTPAPSAELYRRSPQDACLTLPHAMVFCANPALWGFSLWGTPLLSVTTTVATLAALPTWTGHTAEYTSAQLTELGCATFCDDLE